jgi:transcriptional regulator of acetoin/glycerol metabolism
MSALESTGLTRPCRISTIRVMQKAPRVSRELLTEAIHQAGSPEKAAPLLGVSRRTIYRWMEFYGITRTYAAQAA